MDEVHALAAKGYKEVVLTGIHLSSYGVDFPAEEKETLLSLIRAVHEVEGIERIRLGSLEPGIITEEFVQSIAALPKMCPHFHLSLQSGCDTTVERMNRREMRASEKISGKSCTYHRCDRWFSDGNRRRFSGFL